MARDKELYEVTIVGGGPTGLFAAFYSGMRQMKTKVIESGRHLGGKVAQFYPEKYIYDVGGIPRISGEDLVRQMQEQAERHEPEMIYNQYVTAIDKMEDGNFALTTESGEIHYSKTVILATGFGIYEPVRLTAENASAYEGGQLHYSLNNRDKLSGKTVMIVSKNRVGIDWALALEEQAEKVILVNESGEFQHVGPGDEERLAQSTVEVRLYHEVVELIDQEGRLSQARLVNQESEEEIQVTIDEVLVYQGIEFKAAPFKQWNLAVEKSKITVDAGMAANVEGIFAAGDAVHYPRKSMLIASGYTEACTAVNSAKFYIDPKASAQVYSTVEYKYSE
ncbi:NAD(P)-binding protein [Sediminibacillus dalangtanensis]|uniref:Ferredoxin--NADP reductase n=1 Tax=Sediminibacillus dalangtanensis TaxID=2729421 RepID=A0ABX7VN20_9BACI|nr:NAD(P)/FAD-dependent oxidoreductase [Sediminibacillus dalangtanensis]QTM97966.1 NAD(P)-binding protein [Sediminibacillus dalangtanensis]